VNINSVYVKKWGHGIFFRRFKTFLQKIQNLSSEGSKPFFRVLLFYSSEANQKACILIYELMFIIGWGGCMAYSGDNIKISIWILKWCKKRPQNEEPSCIASVHALTLANCKSSRIHLSEFISTILNQSRIFKFSLIKSQKTCDFRTSIPESFILILNQNQFLIWKN